MTTFATILPIIIMASLAAAPAAVAQTRHPAAVETTTFAAGRLRSQPTYDVPPRGDPGVRRNAQGQVVDP